jgi:hypothetical protein
MVVSCAASVDTARVLERVEAGSQAVYLVVLGHLSHGA